MDAPDRLDRDATSEGAAEIAASPDAPALPLPDRAESLVRDAPPALEPGRALALADFAPPRANPGERLIRLAYRLGVPGSALSSPFAKPGRTRLLASVDPVLPGNRVAGMALRAGHFLVHGVKAPVAQVDMGPGARLTPPFEASVHGFDWLRDLSSCAPRPQCLPVAERIVSRWLAANTQIGKGNAWKVGTTGQRLLNALVHAPLLLAGPNTALRTQLLDHIAETARWLDRRVGRAEDRLAETAGWCAIVAAGLLLPDGKPRRLYGEAGLLRALGDLVGDDGGVLSRSPLDQMAALRLLVNLRACYDAVRREFPDSIARLTEMMVPPLMTLLHGDGALGGWQGAWAVRAEEVRALVEATRVRTRPLKEPRGWGYQRIAAGGSVLQFDAAPPPLARHARHGCASTLGFEFSHGSERLVVSCGGAAAAGGQIPVRIEQGLRASAAHSTLVLDDANSTAVLINGKLGGGVGEVEVDRRQLQTKQGGATRVEASHDGYSQRYGLIHRRILILRDDGQELRGEDVLVPSGRKGQRGKVGYAIRFHLGPRVDVRLSQDRKGALLALPDGANWQMRIPDGEFAVEESMWADGEGKPQPVQQLLIQGLVSRGGGTFSWLLKKMG